MKYIAMQILRLHKLTNLPSVVHGGRLVDGPRQVSVWASLPKYQLFLSTKNKYSILERQAKMSEAYLLCLHAVHASRLENRVVGLRRRIQDAIRKGLSSHQDAVQVAFCATICYVAPVLVLLNLPKPRKPMKHSNLHQAHQLSPTGNLMPCRLAECHNTHVLAFDHPMSFLFKGVSAQYEARLHSNAFLPTGSIVQVTHSIAATSECQNQKLQCRFNSGVAYPIIELKLVVSETCTCYPASRL